MLSKLTVTPLLWACGVLLVACLGLGAAWWVQGGTLARVEAQLTTCQGDYETTMARANGLAESAKGHAGVSQARLELLNACYDENRRVAADNAAAITALEREKADADRAFAAWMDRYATQIRQPDCSAALAQVDALCPALHDY